MPQSVIHAMSDYLYQGTANLGGSFATSLETSALLKQGRKSAQLFLNAPDNSIVFGANMTCSRKSEQTCSTGLFRSLFYAQELVKHYQLQDIGGFLRIGFVHYNTVEEVNRILNALESL